MAAIATLAGLLDGEHHAGAIIDCSKQEALISFNWGYLLAGLGAEVIHIGRPDKGRLAGLELSSYNYGFDALNTGKTGSVLTSSDAKASN